MVYADGRNQTFGVGSVGAATGVVAAVFGGGVLRGGAGSSSIERCNSLVTSLDAFLNSLIPCPKPLASSGSFLAPKRIKTTARMRKISQPPRKAANKVKVFIMFVVSYWMRMSYGLFDVSSREAFLNSL